MAHHQDYDAKHSSVRTVPISRLTSSSKGAYLPAMGTSSSKSRSPTCNSPLRIKRSTGRSKSFGNPSRAIGFASESICTLRCWWSIPFLDVSRNHWKLSFRANWMMRGATLVQKICPNVGDVKSASGSQNCGWLKALKNSERNSSAEFSRGQRQRQA